MKHSIPNFSISDWNAATSDGTSLCCSSSPMKSNVEFVRSMTHYTFTCAAHRGAATADDNLGRAHRRRNLTRPVLGKRLNLVVAKFVDGVEIFRHHVAQQNGRALAF